MIVPFEDKYPKYVFFQLPKLNKYFLGVQLAPAHQVIKKLKISGSSVGLHTVSHWMPTLGVCVYAGGEGSIPLLVGGGGQFLYFCITRACIP